MWRPGIRVVMRRGESGERWLRDQACACGEGEFGNDDLDAIAVRWCPLRQRRDRFARTHRNTPDLRRPLPALGDLGYRATLKVITEIRLPQRRLPSSTSGSKASRNLRATQPALCRRAHERADFCRSANDQIDFNNAAIMNVEARTTVRQGPRLDELDILRARAVRA